MTNVNEPEFMGTKEPSEYKIVIYEEEDITWEMQNEIHRLLNVAFKGKSIKFIAKTYANIRPTARVLCFINEKLVGHTGINEDVMHVGDLIMPVGCLGLTAVTNHNKGLGIRALKAGVDYLRTRGFELAVGVTNSPVMLKYIVPKCGGIEFAVPIKGKSSISKPSDFSVIFPLNMDSVKTEFVKAKIIAAMEINLEGEVF